MIRSPFNITRGEGTTRILSALIELNKIEPSVWKADFLNLIKPEDSDDELVVKLLNHLPIFDKSDEIEVQPRYLLSWVCHIVEIELNKKQCLSVLQKRMRLHTFETRRFFRFEYGLRLIYSDKTNKKIPSNIEDNLKFLSEAIAEVYGVNVKSYQDVERFFFDSKQFLCDYMIVSNSSFALFDQIEFENFIEEQALEYAAQNINEIVDQAMKQLIIEKMVLLQQEIYNTKGEKSPSGFERKWADEVSKLWRKRIAEKISLAPGGNNRKTKGFWNDERIIEFYRTVENLPKIKPKSLKGKKPEVSFWEYALNRLIEDDFDILTINLLKKHQALEGIPATLFDKAVKTWRKHSHNEDWNNIRKEEKPRAFEYYHALHLLGFPIQATYSSLETYYYGGKSLSENQNQT